jgi:hypothetical protein
METVVFISRTPLDRAVRDSHGEESAIRKEGTTLSLLFGCYMATVRTSTPSSWTVTMISSASWASSTTRCSTSCACTLMHIDENILLMAMEEFISVGFFSIKRQRSN